MNEVKFGTGAEPSPIDIRTVQYDLAGESLVKGGVSYSPDEIEHQHIVGICTAISRVQLRQKQTGKKYCPDFHYLLQKKFYDLSWYEGSSIFHSNKVAKKYGFLPANKWTYTTEKDRLLPYSKYIEKLKSIPDEEIYRLIDLCIDPIVGYANVDVSDPQKIAKAINEGSGILCRYDCGSTWWLPSWKAKDINPLRKPNPATSGHAIIMNLFDYSKNTKQGLTNTWGPTWCDYGCANVIWDNYKMTEAWVDLNEEPKIVYKFTKTLRYKSKGVDVVELQKKLNEFGFNCGAVDGDFGKKTLESVKKFQTSKKLIADGIVGPKTNIELNKLTK